MLRFVGLAYPIEQLALGKDQALDIPEGKCMTPS